MNGLTISLFMITLVVVIFALMLYKFYLKQDNETMFKENAFNKGEVTRLKKVEKEFGKLALKHSKIISIVENGRTLEEVKRRVKNNQ